MIDGELEEAAWQRAEAASDFTQREPHEGTPATERTEVRVVYTRSVLYLSVHAFDSEPEHVVAKEMERDATLYRDDAVVFVLDTFGDHRNGYAFETNPNGARFDALVTDEGRDVNVHWDGVWDAAGRRTADGWSAELAIPFSTRALRPAARHLGPQRPAHDPAQERGGALGAAAALDRRLPRSQPLRGVPHLDGRRAHRSPRSGAVAATRRRAVPGRRPVAEPGHRRPRHRGRHRGRPRRQVGDRPRDLARPDLQHRLRRGRGRPAAGEPDALLALLSGEARLLPRERGHLRVRPAQSRDARSGADEGLLLAADRARGGARGADRLRRAAHRTRARLERRRARDPDRRRPASTTASRCRRASSASCVSSATWAGARGWASW